MRISSALPSLKKKEVWELHRVCRLMEPLCIFDEPPRTWDRATKIPNFDADKNSSVSVSITCGFLKCIQTIKSNYCWLFYETSKGFRSMGSSPKRIYRLAQQVQWSWLNRLNWITKTALWWQSKYEAIEIRHKLSLNVPLLFRLQPSAMPACMWCLLPSPELSYDYVWESLPSIFLSLILNRWWCQLNVKGTHTHTPAFPSSVHHL